MNLESLTQIEAAQLLNVDQRTLRRWHAEAPDGHGPPRNSDGSYHWPALMWWRDAQRLRNRTHR